MLKYKNHQATLQYDEDSNVYWGCVLNTRDLVVFQADSLDEVQCEFEASVDSWLEAKASIEKEGGYEK